MKIEMEKVTYKKVTTHDLVKSHKILYDAIENIEVEIELREFNLRCLKLGYGEGIDGMVGSAFSGYNGVYISYFSLKLPY